jgi:hypothetical protein
MKYTKEYLTNNKVAISCPNEEDKRNVVFELLQDTEWCNGSRDIEPDCTLYPTFVYIALEEKGKIFGRKAGDLPEDFITIITAKEFLEDRRGKWDIGMLTCDETLIGDAFWLGDSLQERVNAIGTRYIEDKPKKTIMKTLTNTLKKILPGDIQTQYKAGFRNGDIELTQEGVTELLNILAEKFQPELTARAEEIVKEEEKKN